MKYLIKNTTRKTIYKKVYSSSEVQASSDGLTIPAKAVVVTSLPIKKNGVKLATWSRGFDFTPFRHQ